MAFRLFAYLKLLDGIVHRLRKSDVSGDVGAGEQEVEAVRAATAQLAEIVRLPVQLAHELLLARKVAQHVGAGQVPSNKEGCQ